MSHGVGGITMNARVRESFGDEMVMCHIILVAIFLLRILL